MSELPVVRVLPRRAAATAAALSLLLAAAPLRAAVPDDLKLDRYPGFQVGTEPAPNPHAALSCDRCHVQGGTSYAVARRFGLQLPLIGDGDSVALLCERCHKEPHDFHPVSAPIKRLAANVARAAIFPVEMPVEGIEKIACTTCHAVHFPHAATRLLRGFPVNETVGGAPFRTRLDFCRACHGEREMYALSGHAEAAGDRGCGACHEPRDIAGAIGGLKKGLNQTCARCHPLEPGRPAHFYLYDPFPDIKREDLAGYGVVLTQGRFTCATCHTHHRKGPEAPFLKAGFVAVVTKSSRVNPHQTTRFCLNCHPVTPPPPGTPGAVAPLVDEDLTRLCRACHGRDAGEGAPGYHPLSAPTAAVAVPKGWPLRRDGTLGCQTCHLAGHAPRDPQNPRFLRGGPYSARNEPCFRCHREEAVLGRNIHREVAQGQGCDFCHEMKDRNALTPGGKAGPVLAGPNLLCLSCHGPLPHPASSNHTVAVRPTAYVAIDTTKVLLTAGRITCHTCHDSHSGSTESNLLRTVVGIPICTQCHPF